MRKLVSITVATCLAGAGLLAAPVGASASPAAPSAVPPVAWGSCTDPDLAAANAQCGYVTVPLDHSDPGGRTIRIAVSRIRHTVPKAEFQGVMVTNPGGPGGSGLYLATLGSSVPGGAGAAYDWIGFDPRGIGASKPALSCIPTYAEGPRPIYEPRTPRIERAWLARAKSYAAACAAKNGDLLRHITTVDVVKDVEYLRKALRATKINYYGFSYGTYLGQVYATLFPSRVRRMIIDGTVDPRGVWYDANIDQDYAFEKAIHVFFGWLADHDDVYHLGTTADAVEKRYYAERAALRRNPAGGEVGPSEWSDIFLYAGYAESLWPFLGDLFADWVAQKNPTNAQALVDTYAALIDTENDNGYAGYLATECTDAPWPRNWSFWRRDNWRVYGDAPFVTWGNAWFNAPCAFWHAKPRTPVEVDGSGVASVLMINETLDAATPYAGSLHVRSLFPGARLIAVVGGVTHANSLSGNVCVDDRIAAYLATGALPQRRAGDRADVRCARPPLPTAERSAPAQNGSAGAARALSPGR